MNGYVVATLPRAHPQTRAVVIDDSESEPRVEPLRGIAPQHPQLDIAVEVARKRHHGGNDRRADAVIAVRAHKLYVAQKNLAPVARQADAAHVAEHRSTTHDHRLALWRVVRSEMCALPCLGTAP